MKPWEILQGDVRKVCKTLEADSFDAALGDPPYGLRFMGKRWDYDVPSVNVWTEVLRVLKPGAYAAMFGGSRTYHRMAVGIEDAGFELRDCLMYLYGSGFPKSLDVSKALDKAGGKERKIVGRKFVSNASQGNGLGHGDLIGGNVKAGFIDVTAPSSNLAKRWEGYGTALKPAWEPLILACKPMNMTVASNVAKWGTGVLAIDACRIGHSEGDDYGRSATNAKGVINAHGGFEGKSFAISERSGEYANNAGRWPANLILDEEAAAMLDAQAGECGANGPASGPSLTGGNKSLSRQGRFNGTNKAPAFYADAGGPSRFFYTAKVSKAERNNGDENDHPTLKPIDLIRYFARLLLPPPGDHPRRILVPFSGSGSEMIGCMQAGWDEVVGIEREANYIAIAKSRITQSGVFSKRKKERRAL